MTQMAGERRGEKTHIDIATDIDNRSRSHIDSMLITVFESEYWMG